MPGLDQTQFVHTAWIQSVWDELSSGRKIGTSECEASSDRYGCKLNSETGKTVSANSERVKRSVKAHPEKHREQVRRWAKENPEKLREAFVRPRARLRQAAIMGLGGRCSICHLQDIRRMAVDH